MKHCTFLLFLLSVLVWDSFLYGNPWCPLSPTAMVPSAKRWVSSIHLPGQTQHPHRRTVLLPIKSKTSDVFKKTKQLNKINPVIAVFYFHQMYNILLGEKQVQGSIKCQI